MLIYLIYLQFLTLVYCPLQCLLFTKLGFFGKI